MIKTINCFVGCVFILLLIVGCSDEQEAKNLEPIKQENVIISDKKMEFIQQTKELDKQLQESVDQRAKELDKY